MGIFKTHYLPLIWEGLYIVTLICANLCALEIQDLLGLQNNENKIVFQLSKAVTGSITNKAGLHVNYSQQKWDLTHFKTISNHLWKKNIYWSGNGKKCINCFISVILKPDHSSR